MSVPSNPVNRLFEEILTLTLSSGSVLRHHCPSKKPGSSLDNPGLMVQKRISIVLPTLWEKEANGQNKCFSQRPWEVWKYKCKSTGSPFRPASSNLQNIMNGMVGSRIVRFGSNTSKIPNASDSPTVDPNMPPWKSVTEEGAAAVESNKRPPRLSRA